VLGQKISKSKHESGEYRHSWSINFNFVVFTDVFELLEEYLSNQSKSANIIIIQKAAIFYIVV
jgi:hypothetical protein